MARSITNSSLSRTKATFVPSRVGLGSISGLLVSVIRSSGPSPRCTYKSHAWEVDTGKFYEPKLVDILIRWSQFNDRAASLVVAILSILAGALVSFGAAYGGTLVYEYQFNVEDMKNSTVWDETEVDQFPGDRRRRPPAEPPTEA